MLKNQVLDMTSRATVGSRRGRLSSYLQIAKPRISTMVLFTVWAGSVAGGWASTDWAWLHAMIGTLLIAASGSAVNQYLERYTDFFMQRTAQRPLPGGKLSAPEVAIFAAVTLGMGIAYLMATVHPVATAICVATWVLYAFVYTLLKPVTAWNTLVGAFPGAMPVLVGAAAFDGSIGPLSWVLFLILFWWQFPHFMAIAWKYRQDYADGGLRMVTVTEPTGRLAGLVAVGVAGILLLTACTAVLWLTHPVVYLGGAIGLGGMYGWFAYQFYLRREDSTARQLLLSSLVYLPLQMLLLLLCM
jgi:protoheme IX farnesyltransferase